MAVIERQHARRRPDCPFIFHGRGCGAPRFAKHGNRRPCLGDFQKAWNRACGAIGERAASRATSGAAGSSNYIDAGVDPHTAMA